MNIDEFRALKLGDRISNPMSNSSGEVVRADKYRTGVLIGIRWDGSPLPVNFTERMTAWMHWSKA